MINKEELERMMNALMLKCWGIISIDDTYRQKVSSRTYFDINNSILAGNLSKTVVAIAVPYSNASYPKPQDDTTVWGKVEPFSWEFDYHVLVRERLKALAEQIEELVLRDESTQISSTKLNQVACYVDQSPYNDKEVGFLTGLGKLGKHHMLINDRYGASFFIGYLVYPFELPFETSCYKLPEHLPHTLLHPVCEACDMCTKACPTNVCEDKSEIDMTNCISALTQTKTHIEEALLSKIQNTIYGCSICQKVCPLSANEIGSAEILRSHSSNWVDCFELLEMTQKSFKHIYGQMGFAWRSHWVYKRNALIQIGHSQNEKHLKRLESFEKSLLNDEKCVFYYQWAVKQLSTKKEELKCTKKL